MNVTDAIRASEFLIVFSGKALSLARRIPLGPNWLSTSSAVCVNQADVGVLKPSILFLHCNKRPCRKT
jgi:hypothetical protein